MATLDVGFSWEGVSACSTKPPAFQISGIPDGTMTLRFAMKDLDVPSYNHGGGDVAYQGSAQIPAGSFTYKGPCPPSGAHDYQFTVTAIDASGETALGRGSSVQAFPPK